MTAGPTNARVWPSVLAIGACAIIGVLGGLVCGEVCGLGGIVYLLASAAVGWTRVRGALIAAAVILPAHFAAFLATAERVKSTASVGICFCAGGSVLLALVALVSAVASNLEARTRSPRGSGDAGA